jgi:PBP1b-binding outer membrane lipoprotein LpoB
MMRSIKSLILMLAATAFIGGCGSPEAPDEKAPEKPTSAPGAPPLAGGPTKAPPAGN